MIASRWWNAQTHSTGDIEVNDDKYPIGAYNGPQLRLGIQKGTLIHDKIFFIGPQIILKYLYYNDQTFTDWFSHDDAVSLDYVRSEKAFVLGGELLMQSERAHNKVFSYIFWSFGMRVKFREINTTDNGGPHTPYSWERPLGIEHRTQFMPTINFGVMLGMHLKDKQEK